MQNADPLSKSLLNQTFMYLIKFADAAADDALQVGMQALSNFGRKLLAFGRASAETDVDELLRLDYREYTERRLCDETLAGVLSRE